jgi:hypothetical protein
LVGFVGKIDLKLKSWAQKRKEKDRPQESRRSALAYSMVCRNEAADKEPLMKFIFATVAAAALFASPSFAADIVKDASGAYSCQKGGEVISYYNPYGRVPTTTEQVQCKQAGGTINTPTTKRKARKQERQLAP